MNINTVNDGIKKNVRKDRVGRGPGSGNGKTAGRGHNGQGSRAGSSTRATFEGGQLPLARRIPKRGFNNKVFAETVESVALKAIVWKFADSMPAEITPAILEERGLIASARNVVKLIGKVDFPAAVKFSVHRVSEGAKASVEKAGGSIEILPGKKPVVKNKMKAKTPKA